VFLGHDNLVRVWYAITFGVGTTCPAFVPAVHEARSRDRPQYRQGPRLTIRQSLLLRAEEVIQ
jgi:hypothetical protein